MSRIHDVLTIGDLHDCCGGELAQEEMGDFFDPYGLAQKAADLLTGKNRAPEAVAYDESQTPHMDTDALATLRVNVDDWLWIHSQPSVQSPQIGKLGPGSVVVATGGAQGAFVSIRTAEGVNGWCAKYDPQNPSGKQYLVSDPVSKPKTTPPVGAPAADPAAPLDPGAGIAAQPSPLAALALAGLAGALVYYGATR